jgi:hypothetical protein
MPSVKLDLGRYVTVRPPLDRPPKQDGTRRVLFEVPARLRPSGWSPAIPLPVSGARAGNLADLAEVARIQADAKALLVKLHNARLGREEAPVCGHPHSMGALIRSWESGQHYKAKKPTTQKGYSYHAGLIDDWSASLNHPDVAKISFGKIEAFLALYDDRPTTRRHVKIVLKMLLDHARKLGWRVGDNPLADMKMGAPKSRVTIWEREDVDLLVDTARALSWPAVAALILTEWEIGQRLTDAILFRRGAEYEGRVFRFAQSKTGQWVTIPVSPLLGELIDATATTDSIYLFVNPETGKPFEGNRLSCVFRLIRNASKTNRKLTLRALRHSCVVQLARAESSIAYIASVTGHSIASAEQILQRYLPRDNDMAWAAQVKRGLIAEDDVIFKNRRGSNV